MTAYDMKSNALSQVSKILINGKTYTPQEIREAINVYEEGKK